MQDLDLEPVPSHSPLAKADHKARPGTREGVTDSAFWDSCKVSLQRTEVQEKIGVDNDLSQPSLYYVSGNVLNIYTCYLFLQPFLSFNEALFSAPMIQLGKLSHMTIKRLAQGHTAIKWQKPEFKARSVLLLSPCP